MVWLYYGLMYECIYFDLDDTLVRDNLLSGSSEVLEYGMEEYIRLCKVYPDVPKGLLTNRHVCDVIYPSVYSFDIVIGWEDMSDYINRNIHTVKLSDILSFKRAFMFVKGRYLYKSSQTPKLLYLFLRHVVKNESVLVIDDDLRVSSFFR